MMWQPLAGGGRAPVRCCTGSGTGCSSAAATPTQARPGRRRTPTLMTSRARCTDSNHSTAWLLGRPVTGSCTTAACTPVSKQGAAWRCGGQARPAATPAAAAAGGQRGGCCITRSPPRPHLLREPKLAQRLHQLGLIRARQHARQPDAAGGGRRRAARPRLPRQAQPGRVHRRRLPARLLRQRGRVQPAQQIRAPETELVPAGQGAKQSQCEKAASHRACLQVRAHLARQLARLLRHQRLLGVRQLPQGLAPLDGQLKLDGVGLGGAEGVWLGGVG